MTPFLLHPALALVPAAVQADWVAAQEFMALLPEPTATLAPATERARSSGQAPLHLWSCHGLARALQGVLAQPWEVIDGWFVRRGNQHSWLYLEVEGDPRAQFILDVYPVAAAGGPLLIDAHSYGSPWPDAYLERSMAYSRAERAQFDEEGRQARRLFERMTGRSTDVQSLADWTALVVRGEVPAGPVPAAIAARFQAEFAAGIGPEIEALRRAQRQASGADVPHMN